MSWHQTRIFAPTSQWTAQAFDTMIRRFVLPTVAQFKIEDFWFTRYYIPDGMDTRDCDWSSMPPWCKSEGYTRSLRFRFNAGADVGPWLKELVLASDYWVSDVREYDPALDHGVAAKELNELFCKASQLYITLLKAEAPGDILYDCAAKADHILVNMLGLHDWRTTVYTIGRLEVESFQLSKGPSKPL